jgi:recombinational DNA repair protein RecT
VVFTLSDRPDEVYELVVVVLSDLGDGRTEMLFQQHGRMSAKQYERSGEGWSSFFDRMAEHLADV